MVSRGSCRQTLVGPAPCWSAGVAAIPLVPAERHPLDFCPAVDAAAAALPVLKGGTLVPGCRSRCLTSLEEGRFLGLWRTLARAGSEPRISCGPEAVPGVVAEYCATGSEERGVAATSGGVARQEARGREADRGCDVHWRCVREAAPGQRAPRRRPACVRRRRHSAAGRALARRCAGSGGMRRAGRARS